MRIRSPEMRTKVMTAQLEDYYARALRGSYGLQSSLPSEALSRHQRFMEPGSILP